jgi:hypothetical protein
MDRLQLRNNIALLKLEAERNISSAEKYFRNGEFEDAYAEIDEAVAELLGMKVFIEMIENFIEMIEKEDE